VADGPDVVVVRHGETEWSRTGRHTGRSDIALTALGERQARALAPLLDGRRFARVLTSPLSRAATTARLAGYPDAEVLDDLSEWDYGAIEGRTSAELQDETPGWTPWTHPLPGGEPVEALGARADRVIDAVAGAGGDVLVFAHSHLLRVLAARWCGLPAVEGRRLLLDTGCTGVLSTHSGDAVVRRWNVPGAV